MPNTREKLIELLMQANNLVTDASVFGFGAISYQQQLEMEADHLIANGVTVQKWIPVTERLPDECKEVLAYRFTGCEVDSCVSHQKAYWSYDPVSDYPVTHWMPLPEPPKGE